jgi:hypothetical protein
MTLKEESVIEMIYTKDQEEFWLRFSMIPIYNSENELSHWVSIQRCYEERNQEKKKEHLIRELTQNNKDLKQFYYLSQPQGFFIELNGLIKSNRRHPR